MRHQIAGARAADSAIWFISKFLRLRPMIKSIVDADLAEFIDDDGVFLTVVFRQIRLRDRWLGRQPDSLQHGH